MASKQSNLSFVLFVLGMVLLMSGLLLVPNQLFGDDPILQPAPPAPPPTGVNCDGRCDRDQTAPCCVYDKMNAICNNDMHSSACLAGGSSPDSACTAPGGTGFTCAGCKCVKPTGVNFCECKP